MEKVREREQLLIISETLIPPYPTRSQSMELKSVRHQRQTDESAGSLVDLDQ